jgi:DNA-binding response OmpR family regulator
VEIALSQRYHTFFRECHVQKMAMRFKVKTEGLEEIRLSSTLLLLSDDEALVNLVLGIVEPPWKLVRSSADRYTNRRMFTQPNVRLVILDDQTVKENDRSWLLARIRKHFSGTSLLYVAGSHSDGNERRARSNGAHYYVSKPLALDRFGHVLQSFLRAQGAKG